MGNDQRRLLVTQAMEAVRLGTRPDGNKSSAWAMNEHTLWAMCCERVCLMRNAEDILRDYAEEIQAAKVPPRNIRRFIQRVREECNRLQHAAWLRLTAAAKVEGIAGDPLAQAQVLMERMTIDLLTMIESGDLKTGSTGDKNAVLRGIELATDAVKTLADARHKDTQSRRIEGQLREIADKIDKAARTRGGGSGIVEIAQSVRRLAGEVGGEKPQQGGAA